MKIKTLAASCPAYDVYQYWPSSEVNAVDLKANDKLGLCCGDFYREYTISSVVSYALETNRDPIAMYNNCVEKGHECYWINADGCALTSHTSEKRTLKNVEIGMRIRFEGKLFTIESAANNNLKLVQIAA